MTINTLYLPDSFSFISVVEKLREYCGRGGSSDGKFEYTETENRNGLFSDDTTNIFFDPITGEAVSSRKPSRYILGPGDIDILNNFFPPAPGKQDTSVDRAIRRIRRGFWWKTIDDLLVMCELTAPLSFWALDEFRSWFGAPDPNPVFDFSKYGEVSASDFLNSLTVSGKAAMSYHTLALLRKHLMQNEGELAEIVLPWIEQLPYADIFICNEKLYEEGDICEHNAD